MLLATPSGIFPNFYGYDDPTNLVFHRMFSFLMSGLRRGTYGYKTKASTLYLTESLSTMISFVMESCHTTVPMIKLCKTIRSVPLRCVHFDDHVDCASHRPDLLEGIDCVSRHSMYVFYAEGTDVRSLVGPTGSGKTTVGLFSHLH